MNNDSILKVNNLEVRLNNNEIIKNLSFEVEQRDFFTILGPNGAGKTTLFRTLLGFIPYQGEVTWSQQNFEIGYLPGRLSQTKFKKLPISVKEFFKFKESSEKKIFEILKLVELENSKILEKNPGDLSSGQFQRMLIGWVLIGNPQVLLFDEPTTGIDIEGKQAIYSLLNKFWKERDLTILLVTHNLYVARKYSTNVLCMNKKAICSGSPQQVLISENLEKLYGTGVEFHQDASA